MIFSIFFELFGNFLKQLQLMELQNVMALALSSPPLKALDKEKELLKQFSLQKLGEWEPGRWGFWNLLPGTSLLFGVWTL